MAEHTYREFVEDVVQLDAESHHKGHTPRKVWLVDRESGMRFGVTVVRHMGDSLEIGFSSINPEERWRIVGSKARNPVTPGDHVLDMSTFDRRNRTATCSTCGPETELVSGGRPGMPRENWHCPRGREAMEVRTA